MEPLALTPDRVIEYFQQLVSMPSSRWTDFMRSEHDRAFVVAGAMKMDLVEDLRSAVDRAIQEGTTLADFRKNFDAAVARHGWDYKGTRGWRTRVIYETNLTTAYAAGELERQREIEEERPYWRYRHGGSLNPREQHLAWDGMVLRSDDPFWETHYPPNGWGCSCYVDALDEHDLRALGKDGPDRSPEVETYEWTNPATGEIEDVPQGIDAGWDYQPGDSWVRAHTPAPGHLDVAQVPTQVPSARVFGDRGPAEMPPARGLSATAIPGMPPVQQFLSRFGATPGREAIFRDAAGSRLVISDAMLVGHEGANLGTLAETIADPDEIWAALEPFRGADGSIRWRMVRRYLARWLGSPAAVEWTQEAWAGQELTEEAMNRLRRGVRIYRRGTS